MRAAKPFVASRHSTLLVSFHQPRIDKMRGFFLGSFDRQRAVHSGASPATVFFACLQARPHRPLAQAAFFQESLLELPQVLIEPFCLSLHRFKCSRSFSIAG